MPFRIGPSRRQPKAKPSRPTGFHAVSIRPSADACAAAQDAKGDRLLASEAPLLPLKDCDRPMHCACRYQHFDDRRDAPRRQADGAPPSVPSTAGQEERRAASARRAEDRLDYDVAEDPEPDKLSDTYFGFRSKT